MRRPDFVLPGYLHRWHLLPFHKRWPNVYLHHILAPDKGRDPHDHPAWSITIVLRGHYVEMVYDQQATYSRLRINRRGAIRFRAATTPHRITNVSSGGCWTLWIRGGHRRTWGFWKGLTDWVPWKEYPGLMKSIPEPEER